MVIVIVIIGGLVCAFFTSWIASQKGYSGGLWFFLGLVFNVFALLSIGFAPNLYQVETWQTLETIRKRLSGLPEASSFQSTVTNLSQLTAISPSPSYENTDTWTCKKCGSDNSSTAVSCQDCGAYK